MKTFIPLNQGLRACLKIVAADVRKRSSCENPASRPPPHVGGYWASEFSKHAPMLLACGFAMLGANVAHSQSNNFTTLAGYAGKGSANGVGVGALFSGLIPATTLFVS